MKNFNFLATVAENAYQTQSTQSTALGSTPVQYRFAPSSTTVKSRALFARMSRVWKYVAMLLMLLTLGVGQMWAATWSFSGTSYMYFYNKAGWTDSGKMLFIGKDSYTSVYSMSAVSNTKLWRVQLPSSGWTDATYMAVAGGGSVWGSGGWGASNRTNATHYTNTYTSGLTASNTQVYTFIPDGTGNNANIALNYEGTTYTALNKSQTINVKVTTDGGSTYSTPSTSPATISFSSKTFSNLTTCGTSSTGNFSGSTKTMSKSAGITATTEVSYSSMSSDYTFVCWHDGSSSVGTGTTYTYYPTSANTITARFTQNFPSGKVLYLKPNADWKSNGARFAAYFYGAGGNTWVDCSRVGESDYWTVTVPSGNWGYVIFCRMNGADATNDFNDSHRWNQTSDLMYDASHNGVEITGWNESQSRVTVATATITGTYHYFPGETISLTVTPMGDDGAAKTYQWYKGGKENANKITGATSATYTKASCTYDDAGAYYCKVTWGGVAHWADNSTEYNVKILRLWVNGSRNGDPYGSVDFTKVNSTTATATINLGLLWTYGFSIGDGCDNYYGNIGTMTESNCNNWTMDVSTQCALTTTNAADYTFTVNYSNLGAPVVSVTYPKSNQPASKTIYFDNNVLKWANVWYRIGRSNHSSSTQMTLVPGTANLYEVTTSKYDNFYSWLIANAQGGTGDNKSIYNTKNTPAITSATNYIGDAVTATSVTVTPGSSPSTGGTSENNNCSFYGETITSGMKTDAVTITAPTNGTITVSYTNTSGSAASFTSGSQNLAHTCIITPTGTGATGYHLSGLTVNGNAHTSGTTYTVTDATTVAATFAENTYDLTFTHNGHGTIQVGGVTIAAGNTAAVNHVTTKTLVATPAAGYYFVGWLKTGSNISAVTIGDATASTTIKATNTGATITAVFAPIWRVLGSGEIGGWETSNDANLIENISSNLGYADITLAANTSYTFKLYDYQHGNWFGLQNATSYSFESSVNKSTWNTTSATLHDSDAEHETPNGPNNFQFTSGGAGTYRFYYNISNHAFYIHCPAGYKVTYYDRMRDIDGTIRATTSGGAVSSISGSVSGTQPNTKYFNASETVTITRSAPNSGYSWVGWYQEEACTNKYTTGGTVTVNDASRTIVFATLSANKIATALYAETATTVTLNSTAGGHIELGGATVSSTTVGKYTTRNVTAVADPGYYFTGWTKTSGTDYSISSTSAATTTITGGGAGSSGQVLTANFAPRWTVTGNTEALGNWATPGSLVLGNISTSAGVTTGYVEVSLAAHTSYEIKMWDKAAGATKYVGSATEVSAINYSNSGTAYNLNTYPGYNFKFLSAGAGTYRITRDMTNNKVIITYPTAYTVTYHGNGSTSGSVPVDGVYYGSGETVNVQGNTGSLAKTGDYTLSGWNTTEHITGTTYGSAGGATFTITGNTNLYAKWTQTITLNANGGSSSSTVTATYNCATLPSITNPTKTGYTFGGWYSGEGGTGTLVINTSGVLQANVSGYTGTSGYWTSTTARTLYAKWTEDTHTVTVAAGANGTVSPTSVTGVGIATASGTITATPNTGYHFNNWTIPSGVTIASGSTTSASITINATADSKTITANFAANTNTAYTVKHYQQNLDGTYPSTPTETQNLTGTTGASVTPAVKSYTGFTAPSTQTVTILADGSRVVTYQYTRNSYTLTWALDGGSISSAGTAAGSVKYGASLTAPTVTKTGYTFSSWSPSVPSTMPAANSTYTAQWTEKTYSVTFYNGSHGTVQVASATIANGGTASVNHVTTKTLVATASTGYTFAGWTTTGSVTLGSTSAASTTIKATAAGGTVTATWTANEYTASNNLDKNGGSTHGQYTATYNATSIVINTAPTRTGYSVEGYYKESACSTKVATAAGALQASVSDYTNSSKQWIATSAPTLYTKWTQNRYYITFTHNGNGTIAFNSTTIAAGGTARVYHVSAKSLVATPNTGYHFTGWTVTGTDASKVTIANLSAASTTIKASGGTAATATVTAGFAPDEYTITYKDQGDADFSGTHGSGYPTSHTYGTATALVSPTKTGYTFGGWYTTSACTGDAVTSLGATAFTANITLYAKWTINTYTVTVVRNNDSYGTVSQASVTSVPYGSTFSSSSNTFTINGTTVTATPTAATAQYTYAFSSWTNASGTVTGDVTVTANFTRTVNQYTITWKSEDGTSTLETDASQAYGTATAFNGSTPTKATTSSYTYTFDGWATSAGGAKAYDNGSTPTVSGAATYYAHFSATENVASVTINSVTSYYTTMATAWTAVTGSTTYPPTITILKDVTITGQLSYAKSQTCTLDLNGHTITSNTDKQSPLQVNNASATFIITDGTVGKAGKLSMTTTYAGDIWGATVKAGTFRLEAGTIEISSGSQTPAGVSVANGATFTMNGGTIHTTTTNSQTGRGLYSNGTATINDGTIIVEAAGNAFGIDYVSNGVTTVNGGKFNITSSGGTAYITDQSAANNKVVIIGGYYNINSRLATCVSAPKHVFPVSPALESTYNYEVATGYNLTWTTDGDDLTGTYTLGITKIGTTIVQPNTPTKTGYTFSAWTPAVAATMPSSDTEYTATWTEKSYTVTFYNGGHGTVKLAGSTISNGGTASVNHFTTKTLAATASTGYTFNGWTKTGGVILGNDANASTTIRATATGNVTATWTPTTYTLSYDLAGGNVASPNPTSYTIESSAITLNNPTKDNYVFAGWTGTDLGGATTTVTIPAGSTGNRSYTATWNEAEASVTINGATTYYETIAEAFTAANGSTSYAPTIKVLKDISGIATKLSYTNTSKNGTLDLNSHTVAGTVNQLLYVNSSKKLTVINTGGSENGKISLEIAGTAATYCAYVNKGTLQLDAGTIYINSTQTSKSAYAVGVNSSRTFTMNGGKVYAETTTRPAIGIYALGSSTTTINDGIIEAKSASTGYGVLTYSTTDIYGGKIKVNAASTGYGIDCRNGTTTVHDVDSIKVSGTAVYGAYVGGYTPTASASYNGVLNVENGVFEVTGSTGHAYGVYVYSGTATVDATTYHDAGTANISGGTFIVESKTASKYALGVFVGAALTDPVATPQAEITGGKFKLTAKTASYAYAVNTAAANTALRVQGGYYSVSKGLTGGANGDYVAPGKTPWDYYCFSTTAADKASVGSDYNYKVTTGYVITYNAGANSTGTVAAGYKAHGDDFTLSSSTFTRTGYTQTGWSTSDGGSKAYNLGGTYTTDAAITLYPFWGENSYDITFYNGGHGTVAVGGVTVANGGTAKVNHFTTKTLVATASTGYTFNGWTKGGTNASYVTIANTSAASTNIKATKTNATVTANWTANTYSITLDKNGGDANGSATATYDATTLSSISAPTKTGYSVEGYYLEAGCTNKVATAAGALQASKTYTDASSKWISTSNQTLYTKWTANNYTVNYSAPSNGNYTIKVASGTASSASKTANYQQTITLTATPSTGYHFVSWTVTKAGGGTVTVTSNQFSMPADDVTVTATFAINTYAISYAAGTYGSGSLAGGSKTHGVAYTLSSSSSAFTRTGYTYDGWSTNAAGSSKDYNLGDSYTANAAQTFYPHWTATTYTISYDLAGGSVASPNPANYTIESSAITLNNPTKTGYTFAGWTGTDLAEATTTVTIAAGSTGDRSYTATWTANTNTAYTVKHYKQNLAGDGYDLADTDNLTGTTGASVTPAVKSYTGFTAPSTQTVTILADGSRVVTYNYTRNSYTLAWALDGGSISSAGTAAGSVKYGASLTAPTVTKTGYTFAGWSPSVPATMPAANSTYTATWSEKSYNVTFYNGGHGTVKVNGSTVANGATASVNHFTTKTLVATASTGYTFAGWTKTGSVTLGNAANASTTITATATGGTVTATWTANAYNITYKDQGNVAFTGVHGDGYPTTHTYGTATALVSPTKTGYTFGGWYTTSACTGDAITSVGATAYTADFTLYAKWTINSYTIMFDSNGGSAVASITQNYGTAVVAPANPTKTGYEFAGWSPAVPSTMPASNTTCVAQWTAAVASVAISGGSTTYYSTVTGAFTAANAATAAVTITMLSDASVTAPLTYSNTNTQNCTLDLNGHTLTSTTSSRFPLQINMADVTFTITDNSVGKAGKLSMTSSMSEATIFGAWANVGNLVLEAGTIEAISSTQTIAGATAGTNGTFTMNGGTIHVQTTNSKIGYGTYYNGVVTINDGTIHVEAAGNAYGVRYAGEGTSPSATVNGGKFNINGATAYATDNASNITIEGGWYTTNNHLASRVSAPYHVFNLDDATYNYEVAEGYTLTWTTDGDALTGSYTSGTTKVGTTIVAPNTPTKTGYTFSAWTPAVAATMPAAHTEYTATWGVQTLRFTTAGNWNVAANWTPACVPTIAHPVILEKEAIVNVTDAQAQSVVIDQSSTKTGRLIVEPGKELVIATTLRKTTDGSAMIPTGENDVVINSTSLLGLGALVMGSHDGTNKATVNFYTRSNGKTDNNTSVGQYVGTPFNDETNILYNWYNSWVYGIIYPGGEITWDRVNEGQGMDPFRGYCVFSADAWDNAEGHSYWQQGTLNASEVVTCTGLNWQSGVGTANGNNENLLANSWMAPIKINTMEASDFTNADATVYIFNSTSNYAYYSGTGFEGNYTTHTVGTSTGVIPAMQSFSVFTYGSGASVKLDYDKIVYTPATEGVAAPVANSAPTRYGYTTDEADKMRLYILTESGYGDMLYMWERADFQEGFENGWDGRKLFGESYAPQLYAITPDGNMAVNCVADWEGTLIGFRTGSEDQMYTFSFEYEGDGTWYLNDLKAEQSTLITSENTYTFMTWGDESEARFIISRTPISYVPTDAQTGSDDQTIVVKKIILDDHVFIIRGGRMYDVTGILMH